MFVRARGKGVDECRGVRAGGLCDGREDVAVGRATDATVDAAGGRWMVVVCLR
jgi:hypothetical protein